MMNKFITLIAAFACFSAMAEDCSCEEGNIFEGVSAYLDLGYSNASLNEAKDNGDQIEKLNSFAATLGAIYRYNMGNDWLVGAGADVTFNSKKRTVDYSSSSDSKYKTTNNSEIDVTETLTGERKSKRLAFVPSIYASFGKSFNNVLVEVLAGATYTGATVETKEVTEKKAKNTAEQDLITKGDLLEVVTKEAKVRKIVPMVGLRVSYAFNQNLSAYVTGKYIFNAKKASANLNLKKMFLIGAGVAYRF